MSRFADDTEATHTPDRDVIIAKVPETPEREGLPRGFRMRADAHYVETLDSPVAPQLRSVDVSAIETTAHASAAPPPPALVESVRAHGVLQPLLVQHNGRGGRYRLISGHQRLAAARTAGLRQVPCMLHAVSDAKAAELATAAGMASPRTLPEPPPDRKAYTPGPAAASCTNALDSALRSIASAAALMSARSPVAREGAAQLVAVESQRALRLLNVLRVLGGELAVRRAAVPLLALLGTARDLLEREYRTCGLERSVEVLADQELVVHGSEELLRTAVCSAIAALGVAVASSEPRHFEIFGTAGSGDASVVIDIREQGVSIPQRWAERAFDEPWPVADGGTALVLLQAARQVAASHGGTLAIQTFGDSTVARFTLPRGGQS